MWHSVAKPQMMSCVTIFRVKMPTYNNRQRILRLAGSKFPPFFVNGVFTHTESGTTGKRVHVNVDIVPPDSCSKSVSARLDST